MVKNSTTRFKTASAPQPATKLEGEHPILERGSDFRGLVCSAMFLVVATGTRVPELASVAGSDLLGGEVAVRQYVPVSGVEFPFGHGRFAVRLRDVT